MMQKNSFGLKLKSWNGSTAVTAYLDGASFLFRSARGAVVLKKTSRNKSPIILKNNFASFRWKKPNFNFCIHSRNISRRDSFMKQLAFLDVVPAMIFPLSTTERISRPLSGPSMCTMLRTLVKSFCRRSFCFKKRVSLPWIDIMHSSTSTMNALTAEISIHYSVNGGTKEPRSAGYCSMWSRWRQIHRVELPMESQRVSHTAGYVEPISARRVAWWRRYEMSFSRGSRNYFFITPVNISCKTKSSWCAAHQIQIKPNMQADFRCVTAPKIRPVMLIAQSAHSDSSFDFHVSPHKAERMLFSSSAMILPVCDSRTGTARKLIFKISERTCRRRRKSIYESPKFVELFIAALNAKQTLLSRIWERRLRFTRSAAWAYWCTSFSLTPMSLESSLTLQEVYADSTTCEKDWMD